MVNIRYKKKKILIKSTDLHSIGMDRASNCSVLLLYYNKNGLIILKFN